MYIYIYIYIYINIYIYIYILRKKNAKFKEILGAAGDKNSKFGTPPSPPKFKNSGGEGG